jgi:hypothetical protein
LEDVSITKVCECWAIPKIKARKQQFDAGVLMELSDICGIINNPVLDLVEPAFVVFPQLHVKIGLIINVLSNFYLFIDDQV